MTTTSHPGGPTYGPPDVERAVEVAGRLEQMGCPACGVALVAVAMVDGMGLDEALEAVQGFLGEQETPTAQAAARWIEEQHKRDRGGKFSQTEQRGGPKPAQAPAPQKPAQPEGRPSAQEGGEREPESIARNLEEFHKPHAKRTSEAKQAERAARYEALDDHTQFVAEGKRRLREREEWLQHDPDLWKRAIWEGAKKSRTLKGEVDVSASPAKRAMMNPEVFKMSPQQVAQRARDNVTKALDLLDEIGSTDLRDPGPPNANSYADSVNWALNEGLVKPGVLLRQDDSTKFNYTKVEDLEVARNQFAKEFAQRMETGDPVETAAWVHWRLNMTDHFYADGVGRTAEIMAAAVLMNHGIPPPERSPSKQEWYSLAPTTRKDPKQGGKVYTSDPNYPKFVEFYRGLFNPDHLPQAKAGAEAEAEARGLRMPWDESKHKRGGDPENKGRFSKQQGAGGAEPEPNQQEPKAEKAAPKGGKTQAPNPSMWDQPRKPGWHRPHQVRSPVMNKKTGKQAVNKKGEPIFSTHFGDLGRPFNRKTGKFIDGIDLDNHYLKYREQDSPDTQAAFSRMDGKKRVYAPFRRPLHDAIVDYLRHGHKAQPPGQRIYHFMGGGTAAGKSTIVDAGFVNLPDDAVKIDPDDIKWMIPEGRDLLDAGYEHAAGLVHEESSDLAKRVSAESVAAGQNVVLDGTGDSGIDKLARKVEAARSNGARVVADYCTIPIDVAIERATVRAQETGRMVDPKIVAGLHGAVSEVFPKAVEAGLFDEVRLWDTNVPKGTPPRLIAEGGRGMPFKIHNQEAYQTFLDKAKVSPDDWE